LPHLYCAPLFLVLLFSHLERGALARSARQRAGSVDGHGGRSAFFAVGLWLLSRNLGPVLDEVACA